jgi:arylsulfatase A-like enzyme
VTRALAGLALLAVGADAAPTPSLKAALRGRSIVMVSIDTLRADRLGAYGYPRGTSPAIDALAGESVVFERCYSHSPKTAESHMSLMTGVWPSAHGVVNWSADPRLVSTRPQGLTTLAAVLRAAGYRTAAYTEGGNVSGALGFEHGFHSYSESGDSSLSLARLALESLATESERRPLFLFVHSYAVHDPYLPAPEFARLFVDPGYSGRIVADRDALRATQPVDDWWSLHRAYWRRVDARDARDVRHVSDLYDAAIRDMDLELGRLLEAFDKHLGSNSILVLLSDHGEEFQEHARFLHDSLYQEVLHVPLLLRLPGRPARRLADLVQLSDVMPTLLDLVGLEAPGHVQGTSLLGLLDGSRRRPRALFSEWLSRGQAALRIGDLKYLRGSAAEELFDLAQDPSERRNLLPEAQQRAYSLRLTLAHVAEASLALRSRFGNARPPRLDAETRGQLQALGYVGP